MLNPADVDTSNFMEDTLKTLCVLLGFGFLPTAQSEREQQFEKGQNVTARTGDNGIFE